MTHPIPGTPSPSALTVITKKTPGSFGALMKPTAVINGHSVPLEWGHNVIQAQPGVHQIEVHCQYLWKIGKAKITVDNTAAPAAPIYYAAPWHNFAGGAIGHQPVKNPGGIAMLAVIGVFVALMLFCCVGASLMDGGTSV